MRRLAYRFAPLATAAIEVEMLDGLRETHHRVPGADRCHFWTHGVARPRGGDV